MPIGLPSDCCPHGQLSTATCHALCTVQRRLRLTSLTCSIFFSRDKEALNLRTIFEVKQRRAFVSRWSCPLYNGWS